MGNTASCCVSGSPKLRRHVHTRLDSYQQESDLSREETGCNLQHISDRENVDGKRRCCLHGPPAALLCASEPSTFGSEPSPVYESFYLSRGKKAQISFVV